MVLDCAQDRLWCRSVSRTCAAQIGYDLEPCRIGEHFRIACDSSLHRCRARGRKLGEVEQVVSRRGVGIAYMDIPYNSVGPNSFTVEQIRTVGEKVRRGKAWDFRGCNSRPGQGGRRFRQLMPTLLEFVTAV
jgi:hypothetical protein